MIKYNRTILHAYNPAYEAATGESSTTIERARVSRAIFEFEREHATREAHRGNLILLYSPAGLSIFEPINLEIIF